MNILVTGANGQLGREMRIASADSSDRYLFSDITESEGVDTMPLDITDIGALRGIVRREEISAIVNCAAYTNVDAAENDVMMARKLNTDAPGNLAAVMKETGGVLFHISTDYVFGKEPYNTPCNEERKGTPTGVYGQTKLDGEQKIIGSGCNYIIIRTAWLYSEFGRNFCRTMMKLTSEKPEIKVVFDQAGTPTYAMDLAKAIVKILTDRSFKGKSGIYNYSNEGVCSWYDFAKMTARFSGNAGCVVKPCHSDEFPSPVKRPAYSVLDKTKIKETFGVEVPYWTDSLEKCVGNLLR